MQPKTWIPVVGLAVLSACGPAVDEPAETCGAAGHQSLVGSQLAAVTLPADLDARIIGPDTMVTQDYRPGRLNIAVDESGTITRVYCG